MASQGVQPLRISKNSPAKMTDGAVSRPLAEIGPMGVRRNSPSFSPTSLKKPSLTPTGDSSPFEASPGASPLSFWKSRENASPQRFNTENIPFHTNRSRDPSPTKRPSVENLKRVSRVTNSTMYAREQDADADSDASSMMSNRPLSTYPTNLAAAWGSSIFRGHKPAQTSIDTTTSSRTASPTRPASSPSPRHGTPQKSSLSSSSRYGPQTTYGLDDSVVEDGPDSKPATGANTPRPALRQAKSVTFDEQPPQVNEYEMVTPDPSSVASSLREGSAESDMYGMDDSFDHGSFVREDSFDDSLEDADKTPVVLPEDWRFMSPEAADTGLAESMDDPFEKPNAPFTSPASRYLGTPERELGVARSNSVTSNGERRPLPPLPASIALASGTHTTFTGNRLDPRTNDSRSPFHEDGSARAISASSTSAIPLTRNSPFSSPPRPASLSKAEVLGMRASPMPLEDRLQLLSIQNEEAARKAAAATAQLEAVPSEEQVVEDDNFDEVETEYKLPPRVSRESILRKVQLDDADEDQDASSPVMSRSCAKDDIDYANLDPDVAIPSRETSSTYDDVDIGSSTESAPTPDIAITVSGESEPPPRSLSPFDDLVRESSVIHHPMPDDASDVDAEETTTIARPTVEVVQENSPGEATDMSGKTPAQETTRPSLLEFTSFFDKDDDFGFGLGSYLTPSPPESQIKPPRPSYASTFVENKPVLRPATPVDQTEAPADASEDREETVGTPESVIHHVEDDHDISELVPFFEAPEVPASNATIKASGSKLKTRVSATPADLHQMVASRRQASGEAPPASIDESVEDDLPAVVETTALPMNRRQSLGKLDIPVRGVGEDLGLGLNAEFDRLMEAKNKGYLMRQNTKVVVASTRQTSGESKTSDTSNEGSRPRPTSRSAGNSPRKASGQTWTTEPWNGRMRRQSTRLTTINSEKPISRGAVPPMPGQESNVSSGVDAMNDDQSYTEGDDTTESGRLFVKVVGVKDLDLPLPKNERSHFQMTLDNGLHCVTTSWAELGRTAPIGQEFELVVFEDLEFQLLLQTRLERPKSAAGSVASAVSSHTAKKTSTFSRLFTSPKKRREQEKRQHEEDARLAAEHQKDMESKRGSREPSAWDLQNELVGEDGSFARAYVSLSTYEQQAYGRPFTVGVPAWNEWAVEDKTGASTRSKLGGVQRKPPYRIGTIELQMMYLPRPRDAKDEDMPKSMSAAIRQLKEAENTVTRQFEGHLSQQGGDCPYWRRRFFKLNGSKLTAYHDMTRQPRATISLARATKLIDDKTSLTKTDPSASPKKTKGRRKSAFAEDEEGYMFVDTGFRIRFANGEVIDFYADSVAQKDEWMKVLSDVVGRESPSEKKTWMSIVLARERAVGVLKEGAKQEPAKLHQIKEDQVQPRKASRSAPTSPRKPSKTLDKPLDKIDKVLYAGPFTGSGLGENRPPPVEKSPRHAQDAYGTTPVKPKARTSGSITSPTKSSQTSSSPTKSSPTKSYGSTSKSPSKSPLKTDKGSTSSKASTASSPRKPGLLGKRAAVRSMIF